MNVGRWKPRFEFRKMETKIWISEDGRWMLEDGCWKMETTTVLKSEMDVLKKNSKIYPWGVYQFGIGLVYPPWIDFFQKVGSVWNWVVGSTLGQPSTSFEIWNGCLKKKFKNLSMGGIPIWYRVGIPSMDRFFPKSWVSMKLSCWVNVGSTFNQFWNLKWMS